MSRQNTVKTPIKLNNYIYETPAIMSKLTYFTLTVAVLAAPFVSALENYRCDTEMCTCYVKSMSDPKCPSWMQTTGGGGLYYSLTTYSCNLSLINPNAAKYALCYSVGSGEPVVSEFANIGDKTGPNGEKECVIVPWIFNNLATNKTIISYTEDSPPPECSEEAPFTVPVTQQPTIAPSLKDFDESGASSTRVGLGALTAVAAVFFFKISFP